MNSQEKLIEWRAEEVAKIILRKSSLPLTIEDFPTSLFDFFVSQASNSKYKFAVEVKTHTQHG